MPSRADVTPPLGRLIEVRGTTVHAWEQGSGPAVILVHGASGNLRDFTFDLAPRLAETYRVVAFDRPGLGHSAPLHDRGESPFEQAAVLEAAAQAMGLGPAILLGHSFGGAVALAWALQYTRRAAALVPVAAPTHPWPGGLGLWYTVASSRIGGATVVPLVSALAPRGRAEAAISEIFAPQRAPRGYADYIGIDLTLRPDTLRANVRQVNGLKPHIAAMSARYGEIVAPIEIVHGTEDEIVPIDIHSERLAAQVPGARLERLEGVGHMPHHARPEAIVAAVGRAARRARLR